MSIKRALKLINKFAAIPIYNKCRRCGDADPYLGENELCYKCFDLGKEKIKAVKQDVGTQKKKQSPRTILARLQRETDYAFEGIKLGDFILTIVAGRVSSLKCEPHMIYKNVDDYESVSAYIETVKQGLTINPSEDYRFKDKSWAKYFGHTTSCVGVFIPIPDIEKMIEDLQDA